MEKSYPAVPLFSLVVAGAASYDAKSDFCLFGSAKWGPYRGGKTRPKIRAATVRECPWAFGPTQKDETLGFSAGRFPPCAPNRQGSRGSPFFVAAARVRFRLAKRFRTELSRPERLSPRTRDVCEWTDEPWRLPDMMCRVQIERTWYSGQGARHRSEYFSRLFIVANILAYVLR